MSVVNLPFQYKANVLMPRCRKPIMVDILDVAPFEIPDIDQIDKGVKIYFDDKDPESFSFINDNIYKLATMDIHELEKDTKAKYDKYKNIENLREDNTRFILLDLKKMTHYKTEKPEEQIFDSSFDFKKVISDNRAHVISEIQSAITDNLYANSGKIYRKAKDLYVFFHYDYYSDNLNFYIKEDNPQNYSSCGLSLSSGANLEDCIRNARNIVKRDSSEISIDTNIVIIEVHNQREDFTENEKLYIEIALKEIEQNIFEDSKTLKDYTEEELEEAISYKNMMAMVKESDMEPELLLEIINYAEQLLNDRLKDCDALTFVDFADKSIQIQVIKSMTLSKTLPFEPKSFNIKDIYANDELQMDSGKKMI